MNFEIDDVIVTRLIYDEFSKIQSRSMLTSGLEEAVMRAVLDIVKARIIEEIKADKELMDRLTKELSIQLEAQLGKLGKRIAESISGKIVGAMEEAFKTYD